MVTDLKQIQTLGLQNWNQQEYLQINKFGNAKTASFDKHVFSAFHKKVPMLFLSYQFNRFINLNSQPISYYLAQNYYERINFVQCFGPCCGSGSGLFGSAGSGSEIVKTRSTDPMQMRTDPLSTNRPCNSTLLVI